ncbi:MAG TPA: hypothetical protein VIL20_06535 [Sandaracinaceae bacterium]
MAARAQKKTTTKKKRASGKGAAKATAKYEAKPTYETIQFAAAGGTRAFYRAAAELEGMALNDWMRATLFDRAKRTLEKHGKRAYALPPVHPERPKPLPLRRR